MDVSVGDGVSVGSDVAVSVGLCVDIGKETAEVGLHAERRKETIASQDQ